MFRLRQGLLDNGCRQSELLSGGSGTRLLPNLDRERMLWRYVSIHVRDVMVWAAERVLVQCLSFPLAHAKPISPPSRSVQCLFAISSPDIFLSSTAFTPLALKLARNRIAILRSLSISDIPPIAALLILDPEASH